MGGSGGYRRLPGGSAHFSWHTHMHHNIYIIITITWLATVGSERRKRSMKFEWVLPACDEFFLYLHLWSIFHQNEYLCSYFNRPLLDKIDKRNSLQRLSLLMTSHLAPPGLLRQCNDTEMWSFQKKILWIPAFPAAWRPVEQEENAASAWCTWCTRVRAPLAEGAWTWSYNKLLNLKSDLGLVFGFNLVPTRGDLPKWKKTEW